MSRPKRKLTVVIDGTPHELVEKMPSRLSLMSTAPPRSHWLAQGYDAAGHLLVLLVANVPAAGRSPGPQPLVFTWPTGSPSHLLLPDGLAGAMINAGADGTTVTAVGTPVPSFPVDCPTCRRQYDLTAHDLRAAHGPKPGEAGRFTLSGVSDSASV